MPTIDVRALNANRAQVIEVNRVLRNAYILLSLMIGCAALVGYVALAARVPPLNFWVYLLGFIGLSFAVNATANKPIGIVVAFLFAGFIGFAAGPLLAFFNPYAIVNSLVLTAAIFIALSIYTVVKKSDFSWLGQFLTVALFVVIGIILMSIFIDLSPFALLISAFMVFVASALILYQTSAIVLGGERNYVIAATNLFVSIYILFMNLLSIFGIAGDD